MKNKEPRTHKKCGNKECESNGELLPVRMFSKRNAVSKNGRVAYQSYCKKCNSADQRKRDQAVRDAKTDYKCTRCGDEVSRKGVMCKSCRQNEGYGDIKIDSAFLKPRGSKQRKKLGLS